MIVDLINGGTLVTGLAILAVFLWLLRTGRLPSRDQESNRLLELEAKLKWLQEEDIRKGRLISELQAQLIEARERIRFLEGTQMPKPAMAVIEDVPLMVVVGDDPLLLVDLMALRGVRGFRVTRLLPATHTTLKATVERFRRQGKTLEYIHFAVHAEPDGIILDRKIPPAELSELLKGVKVAVFMGCTTAAITDLLGVIPVTVSFREMVPHNEAWQFSVLFWRGLADGLTPEAAFERACDRGPTAIGEYAEFIEM